MTDANHGGSKDSVGYDGGPSYQPTPPGGSVDAKALLYDYQREHFDVFREIVKCTEIQSKRKVLAALLHNNGVCTYRDIDVFLPISERNIRKHISDLAEKGVVEKAGNPVSITFPSEEIEVLVRDTVAYSDQR